jgi:hypothetical protein
MLKRNWALIAFIYLALAEALSLAPVPDLALCLIQPEHGQQTTNYDDKKYCPAFHTGTALVLERVDFFLEHHDKSVVGGFTIVLAISTIGLWLATNKLWSAGERQLELLGQTAADQSREMQHSIRVAISAVKVAHKSNVFIFAQRPRLTWKLHGHGYIEPRSDGKIYLQVTGELTNVGKTPTSGVYYFGKIYVPQQGEALVTPGFAYYDEHLATKGTHPALIASIIPDETAPISFMPQGIEYKLPMTGETNLWLAFHTFYHFGFDPNSIGEIASIYRIVRTGTVETLKNSDGTERVRISVHIQEFSGARRIT